MISRLLLHFGTAGPCGGGSFLVFPPWYKYLNHITDAQGSCAPQISGLNDIWLIAAAIIEILLRAGALIAVGFIIYGGFEYLTSQGEPDKTKKAQQTLINAVVGLVITILAATIINYIAGQVS